MNTQESITFDSLTIRPELKKAISDLGFEKPSPIQAQALPILLGADTDFIGLAATGTGKTVAFGLPLLERIDATRKHVQAIILCPTRELCLQVSGQIDLLGKHLGIRSLPIYGGAGYDEQLRGLRTGTTVVVGTPGRVIDHLNRGTLKLQHVKLVVLDEADEMISMGFREDMETILEGVPSEDANTWLFSATMSPQVRRVADEFLETPKTVQVNRTEMLSSTVQQIGYLTQEKNKPEILCKIIDFADDFYGVIFCQMKSLVVDLTRYLGERGYKVDCLHGDMSQAARESAMLAFRQKRIKILVCTDVASRGLDVKDISHVVNYSLPRELDSYVHRIGRTGRAGKAGIAISLITPSHRHLANKIERMTKSHLEQGTIPTRKEIGLKKIARELETFKAIEGADKALQLLDDSWKEAVSSMSPAEVAARFLSEKFPWVFSSSFERPQMEQTKRPERTAEERADRGPRPERREFSKGASAPKREEPASAPKVKAAPAADPMEIDQDRPFDDGFAENGAKKFVSKEKVFKRKHDLDRKVRRDQEFRAEDRSIAKTRMRKDKPSNDFEKRPEFGGKSRPAFQAKGNRPAFAAKKRKPFMGSMMKEGSAPPPKFKPRSQRGGDLPPRRRHE